VTREDIIRVAREAGANLSYNPDKWDIWEIRDTDLERFAAFVAAHEREECAKVANAWQTDVLNPLYQCDCATAIRRRGEQ
jgi:hypothetical protein